MIARIITSVSHLVHRILRGIVPITLISFLMVGGCGVVVHMLVLKGSFHVWTESFRIANGTAMLVASTFNYFTNNKATFSERELSGRRWLAGYAIYMLITSIGLAASLLVSGFVYDQIHMPMMAALSGIALGALWNYFMSQRFVWKLLHRRGSIKGAA